MQLKHIHHIAIITSDYEKTVDFYVRKLGFDVIRETRREDRGDIRLDLQMGDMELEIFVNPKAPKRPNFPEAQGLRHLAWKVEDLDHTVKELQSMDIDVEPIRVDPLTNQRAAFFKDPDGLPLEIKES